MRMLPSVAKKLTWITLLTQAPGELSRWRCPYLAGGIFSEQKQLLSKSKKFKQHAIVFSSAEIKVAAKLASFVNTIWP
jgi:hypothetical protein